MGQLISRLGGLMGACRCFLNYIRDHVHVIADVTAGRALFLGSGGNLVDLGSNRIDLGEDLLDRKSVV